MRFVNRTVPFSLLFAWGACQLALGCSAEDASDDPAGGGSSPVSGRSGSGGSSGAGGTVAATGGVAAGGKGGTSGGSPSTGGAKATASGGAPVSSSGGTAAATGGNASGGRPSAGGGASGGTTGGSSSKGGASSGGTSTGGSASAGGSGGASSGDAALCPPGITRTITVAEDGSGDFTSVQKAVDSVASNSSERIRIDVRAGTYDEKLTIANRSNLCLVGAGAMTTILTYDDSNMSVGSTSGSASVLISANDFSAANLTFENTHGPGSQAVALRTTGQREQFLNCRFVGYQDTLYTHQGSQYFKNCYVQGNTDYVFGGATVVLENCEVRNVEGGSAVAAPNTDIGTEYGIVFLGGKFTAASGVRANSVGLGRPWGADGAAAYLNIELGAHIIAAGFVPMSGNQPENARFHEYKSTGSGAGTSSRSAYQMNGNEAASYTVASIFGNWKPSYSE